VNLPNQRRLAHVLRRHGGTVAVWFLALIAVIVLLERRSVVVEARGLAQAPSVILSPLEVGEVASVEVGLLQEVRRGQVLVRMDDARLQAEAAVVMAEVGALRAELQLAQADRRLSEAADRRRFTADVEQARLQILEILAELEPDRITLADLARETESYRELLAVAMVSARECERVEAAHAALAGKVAEFETLLAEARRELTAAEERRTEFLRRRPDGAAPDAADETIATRVAVLERRLEEVRVRRDDLALTAPFDGVVIQIPACAGQVVRPGDPVLALTAARVEQIVVWLDEVAVERVRRRGDLAATVIRQRGGRQERTRCAVLRIGPAVVPVPAELWRTPSQPLRGRPVVLEIVPELDLAPGEMVTVRWG